METIATKGENDCAMNEIKIPKFVINYNMVEKNWKERVTNIAFKIMSNPRKVNILKTLGILQ